MSFSQPPDLAAKATQMKLIITIDTEEDDWGGFRSDRYTLANIEGILALQDMFDAFNVKPTYLITYPVATDDRAASILRAISEVDKCEIGAHCHPWNTPPFEGKNGNTSTMLCNLPSDLQYAKMKSLHETIRKRFGFAPLSFRSGRFGYNNTVARNLSRLGYKIDTSITPYTDWSTSHGPDFTRFSPRPFRFSSNDAFQEAPDGNLIEVPATVGFLQADFDRNSLLFHTLTRTPLRHLKLAAVLKGLKMLNKVWLSPELTSGRSMINLVKRMTTEGYHIFNMMFHSPSLKAGLTPFTRTKADEKQLFQRLREFLIFARETGIESKRLSEVQSLL
jgi:hypothetical protein